MRAARPSGSLRLSRIRRHVSGLPALLALAGAGSASAQGYVVELRAGGERALSAPAAAARAATNATDRVENGAFDASPTTGQLRAWSASGTAQGATAAGTAVWDGLVDSAGSPSSGALRLTNSSAASAGAGFTTWGVEQCLRPGAPVYAASPSAQNLFAPRVSVLVPPGQDPGAHTAAVEALALFYASTDCSGPALGGGGVGTPVTPAGSGGWLTLNAGYTSGASNTFPAARSVAVRIHMFKSAGLGLAIQAHVDAVGLRGTYLPVKGDLDRDGETDLLLRHAPTGLHQVWHLKDETRLPAAAAPVAHVATEIAYGPTASAPPGTRPGDLLIVGVLAQPQVAPPAGWTLLGVETPCGPSAHRYYGSYWYRLRAAGDGAWTWTNSVATQIAAYRNVDTGAPFVAHAVAAHGEPGAAPVFSIALPSLTASAAGDAAHYQSLGIYHAAFTPPPGYIDRAVGRADSTTAGDRLNLGPGQASGGTLSLVGNFDSGVHLHALLRAAANTGTPLLPGVASLDWQVAGVADFNADGEQDLLMWNAATGASEFWLMNGATRSGAPVPMNSGLALPWKPSAVADFNGDGLPDVVWRNGVSQALLIFTFASLQKTGEIVPNPAQAVHANWEIVGAVDLNHDGFSDLLWYNAASGKIVYWLLDAAAVRLVGNFTNPPNAGDANWKVLATGDYGIGPGASARPDTHDLVWRNALSGRVVLWFMDGAGNRTSGLFLSPDPPAPAAQWTLAGPR